MAGINLQEIHDKLIGIALLAGEMMLSAHPSGRNSDHKKNSADIVTATDRAIEAMVQTRLHYLYPEYPFFGEETYKPGQTLTSAPTFICDPIDGTTNFIHSFPYFCISLALAIDKTPVIGIIYNPTLDELYTGIKNQGAFLTARGGPKTRLPLRHPEPLKDLSTCLVAIEWGSDRTLQPNYALKTKVYEQLARAKSDGGAMVQNLRSVGSAAMNCAMVATGQLDVYWEGGPWAWDVAAGWCLITEAGGRVVGGNPGDWEVALEERSYLFVRGEGDGEGKVEKGEGIIRQFWALMGDGRLVYDG